jgi:transcriptional regulator with XRE-family HTH domain
MAKTKSTEPKSAVSSDSQMRLDTAARADRSRAARDRYQEEEEKRPHVWMLPRKLRVVMAMRDLSQSGLARQCEQRGIRVSQTRISRWLYGEGAPSPEVLEAIADSLRIPYAYVARPSRNESPDLAALEAEREIEIQVRRIGAAAALDRILMRPVIQATSVQVPYQYTEVHYKDVETRKPRIKKASD